MTPREYISAANPYLVLSYISGAMYDYDPAIVSVTSFFSFNYLLTPKSINLKVSRSNIF